MQAKNLIKLTKAQQAELIASESVSKSQKIRTLFDAGFTIKEIANLLNMRYNFAYNVVSNYIITQNIEIIAIEKITKKQQIIELYQQEKSLKEIAIEMKTNYNYVFNIIKQYKQAE